jgi:hypothetical protein
MAAVLVPAMNTVLVAEDTIIEVDDKVRAVFPSEPSAQTMEFRPTSAMIAQIALKNVTEWLYPV